MEVRRIRSVLAVASISLVLVVISSLLWFAIPDRGIRLDGGWKPEIYAKNPTPSMQRTGYLVFVRQHQIRQSNLMQKTFFEYKLYESPSRKSSHFEVWSDQLLGVVSQGKSTLTGPKVSVVLVPQKVNPIDAEVWFVSTIE